MICTKCKNNVSSLISNCYSQRLGHYIKGNEKLCRNCAKKRGFKTLKQISDERINNK